MANTPTPSTTAISLHLAAYAGQLHPDVVREYAGYAHGVDLARRDMAVIATSPDLTPAGRAKNLDKRRADASKALDPLRATIERTRQRLVDVERSAVPPRPATQDQSTIAREREIRDRLTGKESLTVLQYAIDAVTSGDEDLLHAIEGAPRAFPLLTPRDAQTLRQVRLEKSTAAPLVAQLRDELTIHTAMLQAAERDLSTDPGAYDPVTALAASGTP
jgi:hypothetical protein